MRKGRFSEKQMIIREGDRDPVGAMVENEVVGPHLVRSARRLRTWPRGGKCLTVTDEFTKEGLAIDVDGRIRSARDPIYEYTPLMHS